MTRSHITCAVTLLFVLCPVGPGTAQTSRILSHSLVAGTGTGVGFRTSLFTSLGEPLIGVTASASSVLSCGFLGGALPTEAGISIAVQGAWNLVSIPLTVGDYTTSVLFPTATSNAFAYQGGYVAEPTLTNGKGYWLKFGANQSVPILGFPRSSESIPVLQGWNLIGSVSEAVGATNVQSIPPGLVTTSFFGYASGGYAVADSIRPGMGYWVKVSGNGTLVLTGALTAPESCITILPTAELPPPPPGEEAAAAAEMPEGFALEQNYPNPFNPTTAIGLQITDFGRVRLLVYDLLGRQVATLVDEEKAPGSYTVTFDASNLSTGTYIYRLTAGGYTSARRMILIK